MRPLKVGVQLPEVERVVPWPELRDMIRAIEDLGFDSIWVGDHLLYRMADGSGRGPWETWSTLAAIAALTTRVEFGPFVACTAFLNPGILAKKAATIDEISGGRLVLGLGAGWNDVEFDAYGLPFDHPVSRFEEAFTIIRTLLREGRVDFSGRYYTARDLELLPRGPRAEGPPLMVGSNGARMLRMTMPHVASWNSWYRHTHNRPDGVGPLRKAVDAACRDVGRDPATVERTVAVLVGLTGGRGRDTGGAVEPLRGTPAQIAEGLRAYADEGIGHVQLVLDPITVGAIEEVAQALPLLEAA
jgi:alkanesulfonate monooxygenase SsuD/methylene tetrahydromethanopterin reductase-like flavin-dependent oxidoreductase (luciferase family)